MGEVHESVTPAAAAPAATATGRLNYVYLAIIGVAMGVIAPFTVFAWPVAIGIGMVIGLAGVERARGITQRGSVHLLRALVIVGGTIIMIFLGVFFGGIVALLIVGLAAFSERVTTDAGPTDRIVGRILLMLITFGIWALLVLVLKLNLTVNIGG
jgi:hypothetical protein